MITNTTDDGGSLVTDVTCDQCGKRHWFGWLYGLTISTDEDDEEHEFCSFACVAAWAAAHQEHEEHAE